MIWVVRTICLTFISFTLCAQHPVGFLTKTEALYVKHNLSRYPLLAQSYNDIKADTDFWLDKDIDVPFPKDPAGGYTHDKHKYNYTLIFNSGVLYNITGNVRYAQLVKRVLLKYAKLNPGLPKHPQATSIAYGHLFWQALNDANWLVYAGLAYDLVYNYLNPSERKQIEEGAFKPEVDFITKDLQKWFDQIHNHSVWACAGVGIAGIATGNKEYVDMALKGSQKDGKYGMLALIDGLFSPDGFYAEGPYYTRYAILPFYLFANAVNNVNPKLEIFKYRDRMLQKALTGLLQLTNTDGTFFAMNDALKEKDYTTNELVTAVNIAWKVYGPNPDALFVAKKQQRVVLNEGGVGIATALTGGKKITRYFNYKTMDFTDGAKGNEGGVSVLRSGKNESLTTLVHKYTSHGLSHGHFDKLNYNLYDKGNEILNDYGAVRYIGIEQKFGGRYLRETKEYAAQTIAHNTLVVDEKSHFEGREAIAEKFSPEKLYSSINGQQVKVSAAKCDKAYENVNLQRTAYLLDIPGCPRMLVDVFNAFSPTEHQYDLPFHYTGQLISTTARYKSFTNNQEVLGKANGYQFLWKEAEAAIKDTFLQVTFLNKFTFYTISSFVPDSAQLVFTRTGANDPDFNLRTEPGFIVRRKVKNPCFLSVVEIHGKFDPISEFTTESRSVVSKMSLLQHNDNYTIASITVNGKPLIIAQANKNVKAEETHQVASFTWTGPFAVFYDEKKQVN
jgi:hypothetical protein